MILETVIGSAVAFFCGRWQMQHETRFKVLYGRQDSIIPDLSRRLHELHAGVGLLIDPIHCHTKEEQAELVKGLSDDLITYFDAHRMYLPQDCSALVDRYLTVLAGIANSFTIGLCQQKRCGDVPPWGKVNGQFTEEAIPLRDEVRQMFSRLLGVGQHRNPSVELRVAGVSTPTPYAPL